MDKLEVLAAVVAHELVRTIHIILRHLLLA